MDFGGIKRQRSQTIIRPREKDGLPRDKKHGKLYKICETQEKLARAYENKTGSHHHDAAIHIQKHIRRQLTATRQEKWETVSAQSCNWK